MTTSKASKGVNEVTTTNEHNAGEAPASTNPAGDSFTKIVAEIVEVASLKIESVALCTVEAWARRLKALAVAPAGELPALPEPFTTIYDDVDHEEVGCFSSHQMHAYAREALAASHREPSEREGANGANCAQGEAVARWTEIARDGQLSDWNLEMASLRKYFAGLASQPADKPAGQAVNRSDAAQATDAWPNGEYRLWDSQWANVVNFDRGYESFDKEDAVNHAVKLTEKYMRENIQRAALSEAKRSHVSGDTLAPEPATAGDPDEVYVDFPTMIGTCGPFPIIDGRVAIPDITVQDVIERSAQKAKAPPSAAVPDGMVLVPREPTPEMLASTSWPGFASTDYAHMIAAATANRPADKSQSATVPDAQRGVPARLREALEGIAQYGSDTLSGPADGSDLRAWYRSGVVEMMKRVQDALAASPADISQPQVAHPLPASGANVVCNQSEVSP